MTTQQPPQRSRSSLHSCRSWSCWRKEGPVCFRGRETDAFCHRLHLFFNFSHLYLRSPSVAGVQGGRVVLFYTLIHTQVAHFRVTDLKQKCIFFINGLLFNFFPGFSVALDSPRRRTRCCCTSSSPGKRCPGTSRSFCTADSSSERPSGRCPRNRYRGSARAGFTPDVNLG